MNSTFLTIALAVVAGIVGADLIKFLGHNTIVWVIKTKDRLNNPRLALKMIIEGTAADKTGVIELFSAIINTALSRGIITPNHKSIRIIKKTAAALRPYKKK